MTIKKHTGPEGGHRAVANALSARSHNEERISALGGAPNLLNPVPVYHLALADAQGGHLLRKAERVGWWYPVIGGVEPGFAMVREDGGKALYSGVTHGLLAKRFYNACVLADKLLGASTQEYEPRLFDVPALQLVSLWLAGADDRFVPLMEGSPPGTAPLLIIDSLDDRIKNAVQRRGHPAGGARQDSPTN